MNAPFYVYLALGLAGAVLAATIGLAIAAAASDRDRPDDPPLHI